MLPRHRCHANKLYQLFAGLPCRTHKVPVVTGVSGQHFNSHSLQHNRCLLLVMRCLLDSPFSAVEHQELRTLRTQREER